MKGQTQVGQIDCHYWIEDNFLHLKALDFVYQHLITPTDFGRIMSLMKQSGMTRLLMNYEKGFNAEIMQLDDRPDLYKELQVPLDFRFAYYTKEKTKDILYFIRVLEESNYNARWFTELASAKEWIKGE